MKKRIGKKFSVVGCLLLILALIPALWVSMSAGPAMAADKIKLVLETGLVKTSKQTWGETAEPWTKAITERTNGAVEFQCHYGGEMAGMMELVKATGSGLVDVSAIFTGYFPSQFPIEATYGALYSPNYTLEDPERVAITRILYTEFPEIAQAYTKNNIKKLFTISTPGIGVLSRMPITNIDDFKGLKIRSLGTNMSRMFKAAGAVPVSFAWSDVLDGLYKKIIDGTMSNMSLARDNKMHEVAPYVLWLGQKLLPAHAVSYAYAMNLDRWNKLPADVKRIILEESKKVEMSYAEYSLMEQPIASKQMEKEGAKVHILSQQDLDEWGARLGDIETLAAKELDEQGHSGTASMALIKKLAKLSTAELMAEYDKAWEKEFALIK